LPRLAVCFSLLANCSNFAFCFFNYFYIFEKNSSFAYIFEKNSSFAYIFEKNSSFAYFN